MNDPPSTHRIKLVLGDITRLACDAIVTAANQALCGGHGVDGAFHRAAGLGLFEECRTLGYCPEGEARITGGYLLPCKYVIHTVGPVYEGGEYGKAELLRSCYGSSLQLASSHGVQTIAFPCIATGAHEFPSDEACDIAVSAVVEWIRCNEMPREITYCCYERPDFDLYERKLRELSLPV